MWMREQREWMLKHVRRPVRVQGPGRNKSSNEVVEMPIYLRYIYKGESIELKARLDVKDKGQGEVKIDSQVSTHAVGWMVLLYPAYPYTEGV